MNFCLEASLRCPRPLCTELPNVSLQLLQAHSHPLPRGCSFLHAAFPWNGQNALQLSNLPTTLRAQRASLEYTTLTTYLPYGHEESNTANTRSSRKKYPVSGQDTENSLLAIYKYMCWKQTYQAASFWSHLSTKTSVHPMLTDNDLQCDIIYLF